MTQPSYCTTPYQQLYPGRLDIFEDGIKFYGYQEYTIGRHTLQLSEADVTTTAKKGILESFFTGQNFKGRSFLDLEANSGYFSLWAVQLGASSVTALDINPEYLTNVREAVNSIGLQHLNLVNSDLADWEEPADIVLASTTMHSIYCHVSSLGSLDKVIEKLSSLTKYALLIEWVEPEDPNIPICHHGEFIDDRFDLPSIKRDFQSTLAKYFKHYQVIGKLNETRSFFAAFKSDHGTVDLSCPLPPLMNEEHIISSKQLYSLNGIDYWSRVYDGGPEVIVKQTSAGLAVREKKFLDELAADYFPRVISSRMEAEYSVYHMEKIHGPLLSQVDPSLFDETSCFYELVYHCFKIIQQLQDKGIVHRNIFADNIIMRDGKPVLIDFGWSEMPGNACIIPLSLPRAPDGQPCDIYSLAETLREIGANRYPELDRLFTLMMDSDPSLRITDAKTLLFLLEYLRKSIGAGRESADYKIVDNIIDNLMMRAAHNSSLNAKFTEASAHILRLVTVVNDLESRNVNQQAQLHELRTIFQQLQAESEQLRVEVQGQKEVLDEISRSNAWKVGCLLQRVYTKLMPPQGPVAQFLKRFLVTDH